MANVDDTYMMLVMLLLLLLLLYALDHDPNQIS
jgi:hypothetical protein